MELKALLRQANGDGRAVSPVIGVILMVAITVILAAVIGTFVLGLGDTVQETSPTAQWNWDYEKTNDNLTLTHEGGDSIDAARLSIVGDGLDGSDVTDASTDGNGALQASSSFSDPVTAGDSATMNTLSSGEVRVVWTSQSGDQSSTMSTFDVGN